MTACLNVPEVMTWSRTYAQAVAGVTESFQYNSTTRVAELKYLSKPTCLLPTDIFVSEKWIYPTGYKVDVVPADSVSVSYEPNHILVHVHSLKPTVVTVTINPV